MYLLNCAEIFSIFSRCISDNSFCFSESLMTFKNSLSFTLFVKTLFISLNDLFLFKRISSASKCHLTQFLPSLLFSLIYLTFKSQLSPTCLKIKAFKHPLINASWFIPSVIVTLKNIFVPLISSIIEP